MWTGLCFVSVTSRRQERTNDVPNQIADRSIPMNRMIKLKKCNLLKCKLSFKKLRIKSDSAFRTCFHWKSFISKLCYPLPPFGFGKKTNRKIMKGNNKRVGMKNKTKTE